MYMAGGGRVPSEEEEEKCHFYIMFEAKNFQFPHNKKRGAENIGQIFVGSPTTTTTIDIGL